MRVLTSFIIVFVLLSPGFAQAQEGKWDIQTQPENNLVFVFGESTSRHEFIPAVGPVETDVAFKFMMSCLGGETWFVYFADHDRIDDVGVINSTNSFFDRFQKIVSIVDGKRTWWKLPENQSRTGLGSWENDQAQSFLRHIYGASVLRLQLQNKEVLSAKITFQMAGAKEGIEAIAKACNWKL